MTLSLQEGGTHRASLLRSAFQLPALEATGLGHMQPGAQTSYLYSSVPGAGTSGLPMSTSSASAPQATSLSTSGQSFTLLLDRYSTRRAPSFSRPDCQWQAQALRWQCIAPTAQDIGSP